MSRPRAIAASNGGFSMIEVMVSAAVLAIAILGLAMELAAQKAAKGSVDTANTGRRVMVRLVDSVVSQPYRFPPFSNGGTQMVYVGCFDENGGPVPTDPAAPIPGVKDYIGVYSITPSSPASFTAVLPVGSGQVCTQNNPAQPGGFEVHVAPPPVGAAYKIQVAVIPISAAGTMIQMSASPAFSTSIWLAGNPTVPANPFAAATVGASGIWCAPTAAYTCNGAAGLAGCNKSYCDDQMPDLATTEYCFCY